MKPFEEKKFTIPELVGMSADSVAEHLKLYVGYVKNANLVMTKVGDLAKDMEANSYLLGELFRRFSFEYNGMRNHEVYFSALEGGSTPLSPDSSLMNMIKSSWGSLDAVISDLKTVAMTRGVGWSVLWYDRIDKRLLMSWVDEQHLGQLQDCAMILGIDMWEHSFVADYKPSGKKQYVEDYFKNINWAVIEKNFEEASK